VTTPAAPTTETPTEGEKARSIALDALERRLIDAFQHGFPIAPRPYAEAARRLGVAEDAVIAAINRLVEKGAIDRLGAVVAPHRVGWSTLAAMKVPEARLDEVAEMVGDYPAVNHDYARAHDVNLWFVVAGADEGAVRAVLDDIEARSGIPVLVLPLVEAYHIDLGFALP